MGIDPNARLTASYYFGSTPFRVGKEKFCAPRREITGQKSRILAGISCLLLQCDNSSESQHEECLLHEYTKDTCPAAGEALPLLKDLYDSGTYRTIEKVVSGPVLIKPIDAPAAPPKCCYQVIIREIP